MISSAQNIIINFSVELPLFGCDYNNTDTQINSATSTLTAFAHNGDGEIDVMQGSCIGSPPVHGARKLGIAHNGTIDRYDQFSFDLTQALTAGDTYSLTFWMDVLQYSTSIDGKLEFGISSTAGTFGTLCYSTPTYAPTGGFIQITTTFVAPVNGDFLTVRPVADNANDRCWIHVDNFELTGPPPPAPIDCDIVNFDADTIILPLDDTAPNDYTFAVEDWIKMTGTVESGSGGDTLVVVRADDYIELNPPFESKLGTNAFYNIAPCVPATTVQNENDTENIKKTDQSILKPQLTKAEALEYVPPFDFK